MEVNENEEVTSWLNREWESAQWAISLRELTEQPEQTTSLHLSVCGSLTINAISSLLIRLYVNKHHTHTHTHGKQPASHFIRIIYIRSYWVFVAASGRTLQLNPEQRETQRLMKQVRRWRSVGKTSKAQGGKKKKREKNKKSTTHRAWENDRF